MRNDFFGGFLVRVAMAFAPTISAAVTGERAGGLPRGDIVAVATGEFGLAPKDANRRTAETFTGAPLVSSSGRELGRVHDFLVNERTGRIAFVVVSSGGFAGIGDTLRLVPGSSLRGTTGPDRLMTNIGPEEWERAATVGEGDLAAVRVRLPPDVRDSPGESGQQPREPPLLRANALRGRDVYSGDHEAGEIEGVLLDLHAGAARILLETNPDFAGAGDHVVAPFGLFLLGKQDRIETRLTRSDFNDLYASWNQTTGPRQPPAVADRHRQQRGLPPLRDPNPVDQGSRGRRQDNVAASVASIRTALRSDAPGVEVVVEDGTIILRGSVPNAGQRDTAERKAREAAGGARIANEIVVSN